MSYDIVLYYVIIQFVVLCCITLDCSILHCVAMKLHYSKLSQVILQSAISVSLYMRILNASRRPPRPLHMYVLNWLEVFVLGKHPEPASLPHEKFPCWREFLSRDLASAKIQQSECTRDCFCASVLHRSAELCNFQYLWPRLKSLTRESGVDPNSSAAEGGRGVDWVGQISLQTWGQIHGFTERKGLWSEGIKRWGTEGIRRGNSWPLRPGPRRIY